MSITAMAGRRITVKRRTAFVLDAATVAVSMSPDRQPARESYVQVTVSGGVGTVTVSGTVAGAPDTEVLTFAGELILITTKRFTAIDTPGFATTGLAGETISAKAVGSGGDRHHSASTVVSDWPARLDRGFSRNPNTTVGTQGIEQTRFYIDYNTVWEPQRGDVFIDSRDAREYKVIGDPDQSEGGITRIHHWEIRVEEMKGAATT